MKILALDASTEALSVALLDTSMPDAAREHFEVAPRAHAQRLLPLADALLTAAGWQLTDLDGIAFGRGPGAFTGLRIAAGLVQGLAAGIGCPVAPISTLAAIASRCMVNDAISYVRVVQDARMGEVYTADFVRQDEWPELLGVERVIEPAAVERLPHASSWAAAGNGWSLVIEAHRQPIDSSSVREQWPHAIDIARLAAARLAKGEGVSPAQALPVYVRDDVARKPALPN